MKQPINRLVMLRTRGFFGPLFQKTASGRFIKSVGSGAGGGAPGTEPLLVAGGDPLLVNGGDPLFVVV